MKTSNAIIIILLLAMCTSIQAEQKVIVKDSNGGKNIFNLHSRIVLDLTKEKFVVRNDTRSIVYTSSDERILLSNFGKNGAQMKANANGLDEEEVPIEGGVHFKTVKIGKAIMDADILISLSHFKGHEATGFGGAIKNIGMGSATRAGKCAQHSSGIANIDEKACKGCKRCFNQQSRYRS